MCGMLPPAVVRKIPTCSAVSEKDICLPEMKIGLVIWASLIECACFLPEKARSFVFSGTKVTWNAEQYSSAK
jgi:hypothetical protein